MIERNQYLSLIKEAFQVHPVVALLGPRQCGKTTLAKQFGNAVQAAWFDLENPVDVRKLTAPMRIFETLKGLIVLDEIQRKPDLLPLLRVIADQADSDKQFLILGGASPNLIKNASESLAGRVGFVDLSGFNYTETGIESRDRLWIRGGFPRSFLSESDAISMQWREAFIRTFLERDIPQLGISIPSEALRRFWMMVAHYHGQIWNGAEFARSLGVSENTARRYLDIIAGSFMVRVLPPWFENMKKRQIKSPKLFIRDTGILHTLLSLQDQMSVLGHPKSGASWEGFAIEQLISIKQLKNIYFWGTHAGAELDMLAFHSGKRYGFEFKLSDAPGMTRSMHTALNDLSLEHIWIIYPGRDTYPVHKKVTVIPLHKTVSIPVGAS